MTAAAISISAASPRSRTMLLPPSIRFNGLCVMTADQRRKAHVRGRPLFHARPQSEIHRAGRAFACARPCPDAFPFRLNTGRVRDQWHTMTRTGKSPRLGAHLPEPFVEVNPADAQEFGLCEDEFAEVTTQHARCVLPRQGQCGSAAAARCSRPSTGAARIPRSVEPAIWSRRSTIRFPVSPRPRRRRPRSRRPRFALRGFVLSRRTLNLPEGSWWTRIAVRGGFGYVFAANGDTDSLAGIQCEMPPSPAPNGSNMPTARAASIVPARCTMAGSISACSPVPPAAMPDWDHLKTLFARARTGRHRPAQSSVREGPPIGRANTGPLVCACFGVGINTIREAIASRTATSIEEIGKALRAGTNCGSCIPEMKKLLAQAAPEGKSHDRLAHTA